MKIAFLAMAPIVLLDCFSRDRGSYLRRYLDSLGRETTASTGRVAYEDLLYPDIPIQQQAKAEYGEVAGEARRETRI